MKAVFLLAATLLAGVTSAQTKCTNLTIPVPVLARNGKFASSLNPTTNVELTNLFLELTRPDTNFTNSVLEGYSTIRGTYDLAATYCEPSKGAPDVVQVLTHGVGFDRSYWNLAFNNFNYSYTNVAAGEYGFATVAYDRLGIGASQHGDPLNFVQIWTEMSALISLSKMLRQGTISGIPKFNKVLHVGHSYGSIQTVGVLKMAPDVWDGVALTGYSTQTEFLNYFELAADFVEAQTVAPSYPPGYIAAVTIAGNQEALLAPNAFDPNILPFIVDGGVPPTVGEFLTLTAGDSSHGAPTDFTGPALVITGQNDLPFCGGNCYQPSKRFKSLPAEAQKLFPRAKMFSSVIVPGSGHGLNLQYTHPYTYAQVNGFFIKSGLGPASRTQ